LDFKIKSGTMNKLYSLTLAALVSASSLMAQQNSLPEGIKAHPIDAQEVKNLKLSQLGPVNRNSYEFYLDHSVANFDDRFFVWRYSSSYVASDTALNYVGLALNRLGGFTDPADLVGSYVDEGSFGFTTAYPSNITLFVDSIFAQITHENNSGNYDIITMKLVTLAANGAPTNTVLWSNTDSSNVALSPSGNWLGTGAAAVITYDPQFTVQAGQRAGIVFEYFDPSKTDTLSIIAGFKGDPASPDPNNPRALQSEWKTSYMRYPPFIPNITLNSNVGYGQPVGTNGYFEAQNWGIWAKVIVTEVVGIQDKNEGSGYVLHHTYPNPSNEFTNVTFEIPVASNVTLRVTDLSGRVVFENNINNMMPGKHTLPLNTEMLDNGVYMFTLNANGWTSSKPMVVKH
jgi:hypothetical protein